MAVLPSGWQGSTALNSKIVSYEKLAERVKMQLGFPIIDLEVTDMQIASFIDEALEWYTQYSGQEEKYIMFCDGNYEAGCGIKLDEIVQFSSLCTPPSECFNNAITSTVVIGQNISYSTITTESAYLSVGCFVLPVETNNLNLTTNANTGQRISIKFDPQNPWDHSNICNANCITILPHNSQCYELSASTLSTINFTNLILTYPSLSTLLDHPSVSASDDGIIPISSLECDVLSTIPLDYFPISAFYPENENVGFPVSGYVEIKDGYGVIYPKVKTDLDLCGPVSSQWTWDIDWFEYVPLDSEQVPFIYLDSLSAVLTACANPCLSAPYLSSANDGIIDNVLSAIPYLSGENGTILEPYSIDLSDATHIEIFGLPTCAIDNNFPIIENSGYYATFCLCNSAIRTDGPYEVRNVKFIKDFKLSSDLSNRRFCNIRNTGFNVTTTLTAHSDCLKRTATWVPVDVRFESMTTENLTGTTVKVLSSGFDEDLGYRRKVVDVFSLDYTLGTGGYYGNNLLFSFDQGIVANAFGFDLQGNRSFQNNGYDMLSYHMARGFIDKVRKMVNYITYQFNPDTQYLKLIPEPYYEQTNMGITPCYGGSCQRCYIVGAYVEKPLAELVNKKWVQEWVKMRIMQTVGFIRSKFGNIELFGGASIQGESLISMAKEMEERLLKELRDDYYYSEPPRFFFG